jgi:hypothetical protein
LPTQTCEPALLAFQIQKSPSILLPFAPPGADSGNFSRLGFTKAWGRCGHKRIEERCAPCHQPPRAVEGTQRRGNRAAHWVVSLPALWRCHVRGAARQRKATWERHSGEHVDSRRCASSSSSKSSSSSSSSLAQLIDHRPPKPGEPPRCVHWRVQGWRNQRTRKEAVRRRRDLRGRVEGADADRTVIETVEIESCLSPKHTQTHFLIACQPQLSIIFSPHSPPPLALSPSLPPSLPLSLSPCLSLQHTHQR